MIQTEWDHAERCHTLHATIELPVDVLTLFDFFGDAFQLEQITPPWLHFRVLTPDPIEMTSGALIDYRLKLHGIPIRWQSLISTWDPPHSFTDEQIRGPYRIWRHVHTFEATDTGTIVRDRVKYRVPMGRLINRLFVEKDLVRIFRYRQEKLIELFGSAESHAAVADVHSSNAEAQR